MPIDNCGIIYYFDVFLTRPENYIVFFFFEKSTLVMLLNFKVNSPLLNTKETKPLIIYIYIYIYIYKLYNISKYNTKCLYSS